MILGASACAGNNGQNAGQKSGAESSAASAESSSADESADAEESKEDAESTEESTEESAEAGEESSEAAESTEQSDVSASDLSADESGLSGDSSVAEVPGQTSTMVSQSEELLADAVGTWDLSIDVDGMKEYVTQLLTSMYGSEYSGEDLESQIDTYMSTMGDIQMEMVLNEDGSASASASLNGESSETEGTWVSGKNAEGKDIISVTVSGTSQEFLFDNGQLFAVGQEYMAFSKK